MGNARSANESWLNLIGDLLTYGTKVSPRGRQCRELLHESTVIDMNQPVVTVKQRKLGRKFLCAEAWWILSGRNDVESIRPYSKDIANFSDDGVRFSGAYGPKIADQLRYVVDSLVADAETRQAVLNIWRENPRPSKDIPCTISVQWFIRDGMLHCVDTMRSSDAWLGWPYDVFNFSMLSLMVLLEYRNRTNHRDVTLGNLHLAAGSQHLYESDAEGAKLVQVNPEFDEYGPLDPSEFSDGRALTNHLSGLKDKLIKDPKITWLVDLTQSQPIDEVMSPGIMGVDW